MAAVSLRNIHHRFGSVPVLDDISLDVRDGEFLVLLGPSGCGKSTLLRIIAGLEQQASGSVSIGDRVVDAVRPADRDVAMVFQSYALYPHLSVRANLALPLRMRRLSPLQRLPLVRHLTPGFKAASASITADVEAVAGALELTALLDRKPGQLSGGQRQRVALARAMVRRPAVFLMDEPLSNLDARLRAELRVQIADLHRKLGATFIYVTHDQTEAMTMADRVAVLAAGKLEQLAAPQALYAAPATVGVAEFIGTPRINLLSATVRTAHAIGVAGVDLAIQCGLPVAASLTVGLRPEALALAEQPGPGKFVGRVQRLEHLGSDVFLHVRLLEQRESVVVRAEPLRAAGLTDGTLVYLAPSLSQVVLFDVAGRALPRLSQTSLVRRHG